MLQYELTKTAFHQATLFIAQSGIGTAVQDWLDEHTRDILPQLNLEARVVLTGWLAALLADVPPTESNVTDLVNAFFDEYDTSDEEMSDFADYLRFALQNPARTIDESVEQH